MIDISIPMPKAIKGRKQGKGRDIIPARLHEIYWYERPGVLCIVWFSMLHMPGMIAFGWRWRVQYSTGDLIEAGSCTDCAIAQRECLEWVNRERVN